MGKKVFIILLMITYICTPLHNEASYAAQNKAEPMETGEQNAEGDLLLGDDSVSDDQTEFGASDVVEIDDNNDLDVPEETTEYLNPSKEKTDGYAKKHPTRVHAMPDQSSKVLKRFSYNQKIKYREFTKDWHNVTIYLNGISYRGYIQADDIGPKEQLEKVKGFALKDKTYIYHSQDKGSKKLKGYTKNTILNYASYDSNWYIATTYIKGKAETGFIHKNDVETLYLQQKKVEGIAGKKLVPVYEQTSRDSKVFKTYPEGKMLQMKKYSQNWYIVTVKMKGKATTGYIHASDVTLTERIQNPMKITAYATNKQTNAYTLLSDQSKVLKKYAYGKQLKLSEYTDDWYEATIYVKGKQQKAFFSKHEIEINGDATLTGYANKNNVSIYEQPSTNSKSIRSYQKGKLLKYRPHNSSWFRATAIVNGKVKQGYLSSKDVSPEKVATYAYTLSNKTYIYAKASKSSERLKSYPKGVKLKFTTHTKDWYKATIYINGKSTTGYIHAKDVGENRADVKNLPILMYHNIGDNPPKFEYGLYVPANNFAKQMEHLRDAGYTPIHFDEIGKLNQIEKPILVTFDDGKLNNAEIYTIFKEIKTKQFTPKATLFVISRNVDHSAISLSSKQLKEFSDSGMISIQSHTVSHPFFNDMHTIAGVNTEDELRNSKETIEQITGKPVIALAYPYGSYNESIIKETAKYYDYAVTTRHRFANMNGSMYELDRIRISYDTTLSEFKKMIATP